MSLALPGAMATEAMCIPSNRAMVKPVPATGGPPDHGFTRVRVVEVLLATVATFEFMLTVAPAHWLVAHLAALSVAVVAV
jgi:hypothetical protein